MGDLKPIGSEKLQGDDKIKRILELTYYKQNTVNENNATKKAELIKESSNGVYGIVREKDGYYVKKGLNEGTLDYIGGLFMKNKNRFNSYAEALKRLELLKSHEINEDVTKYVLKPNKSTQEAPLPQDSVDAMPPALPPADNAEPSPEPVDASSEMPVDDMSQDSAPEMGNTESGKRSDYMAEVQKFAGKLGQELRDQQPKMESDDIKYVLNMIISAVDLDKLEDDDIDEIGKKFERDEEMSTEPEAAGEPEPEMEPAPEQDDSDEKTKAMPEDDLAERISKLEELINTKFYSNEQDLGEDESEDYFPDIDSAYEDKTHLDYDPTDDYRIDNRPSRMYDDEDEEINVNLDITPELDDINESINTTLSKYFE